MTRHTLDSTHIVKADLERVWDSSPAPGTWDASPRSMGFTSTRPTL
jgi:hypothetical protein